MSALLFSLNNIKCCRYVKHIYNFAQFKQHTIKKPLNSIERLQSQRENELEIT